MNITVNKLFDIWGDLDSSYEKYKSKLNVSSKSEYIKKLCLDKNGNELFTKTKTILSKEVDSLDNEEDQRKYCLIMNILDSLEYIYENFENVLDGEGSLNGLVLLAQKEKRNASLEQRYSLEEFMDLFRLPDNQIILTSEEAFKRFGEVNNFIKISKGKTVSVKIEDSLDSHFLSFGGDMTPKVFKMFEKLNASTYDSEFKYRMLYGTEITDKLGISNYDGLVFVDKCYLDNNKILGRTVEKDSRFDNVYTYRKNVRLILV